MPTKTVNFGSTKAGLATVGYRIVTSAGVAGDRVTAGVTEVIIEDPLGIAPDVHTGIYQADIPPGTGSILWDTGEATPRYSTDVQSNPADVLDLADGVEAGFTLRQVLRLMAAVLLGKSTNNKTFRDLNDTKNRVVATVDALNSRVSVVKDAS